MTIVKIKDFIEPEQLGSDIRVVFVNIIYVNSKNSYEHQNTEEEKSYISESEAIQVDFMHTENQFNYAIFDDLEASVLDIYWWDAKERRFAWLFDGKGM